MYLICNVGTEIKICAICKLLNALVQAKLSSVINCKIKKKLKQLVCFECFKQTLLFWHNNNSNLFNFIIYVRRISFFNLFKRSISSVLFFFYFASMQVLFLPLKKNILSMMTLSFTKCIFFSSFCFIIFLFFLYFL